MTVNPETGELVEPETDDELSYLRQRVETLGEARQSIADDLTLAERELRNLRRKVKALQVELDEQTAQADEMPMVKTIFQAWVNATGRNPKRTKLGPARTKAVLARIREGRDFDFIMRAATIGAQAANVTDRESERMALLAALREATERLSESDAAAVRGLYKRTLGSTAKFDDLELICRNEVNLERFAAMADRLDPEGARTLLDAAV